MEKEFGSAKQFSKEIQKNERQQTVEAISVVRKDYFTRKENIQKQLQELIKNAESKRLQASDIRKNIELIETHIEEKSRNLFHKILEKRQIKQLQNKLGTLKLTEAELNQELTDLEQVKTSFYQSIQDKNHTTEARAILDKFYKNTEHSWIDYEEDRKAGDVKNLMREHQTFIIHAFISPTMSPSDVNGIMRTELNWQDKLDLLLALNPTISASAVNKNHTKTFASVGVLLGEGQIKRASARDIASRAIDQHTRTFDEHPKKIQEQITESLNAREQGWTEFIVANPSVAGIFFRLNEENKIDNLEDKSDATMEQIVQTAKNRSLPIYALKNGEFYLLTEEEAVVLATPIKKIKNYGIFSKEISDIPSLDIKEERKLLPGQAADLPTAIGEREREAIMERLMMDSPFQLNRFPEALYVDSRANGRSLYYLLKGAGQNQSEGNYLENRKTKIPTHAINNSEPLDVTILKTIPGPTGLKHYIELSDGTKAIWDESRKPVTYKRPGTKYSQDHLIIKGFSLGLREMPYKEHRTIPDLVAEAKELIQNIEDGIETWISKGADLYARQWNIMLKSIASSLYGIAEEAKNSHDQITFEQTYDLASRIFPPDEYQTMIANRVSESGTFKISKEELSAKA